MEDPMPTYLPRNVISPYFMQLTTKLNKLQVQKLQLMAWALFYYKFPTRISDHSLLAFILHARQSTMHIQSRRSQEIQQISICQNRSTRLGTYHWQQKQFYQTSHTTFIQRLQIDGLHISTNCQTQRPHCYTNQPIDFTLHLITSTTFCQQRNIYQTWTQPIIWTTT